MSDQNNMNICPMCGAILDNGYCPSCHYLINETEVAYSNNNYYDDNQNLGSYDNYNANMNAGYSAGYDQYQNQNYNSFYNYNQYEQSDEFKRKNTRTAIIIAVVLSVLCIASAIIVIVIASSKLNRLNNHIFDNNTYDDDDYDWDYSYDSDDYSSEYEVPSLDYLIDWDDKSWKIEQSNCSEAEVWDSNHQYYEYLNNCKREDLDYQVEFKTEEFIDKDHAVCIRSTYYQLNGDIPNIEQINKILNERATYDILDYEKNKDDYMETFEYLGEGLIVNNLSYVTYMDENLVSIVYDLEYSSYMNEERKLCCFTIDVQTGMILSNVDMFDINEAFVNDVIKKSNKQNGDISYLNETSIDELMNEFQNSDSIIAFYTPCGMEVGLNYRAYNSYGWFTTTLTDYKNYLKSY